MKERVAYSLEILVLGDDTTSYQNPTSASCDKNGPLNLQNVTKVCYSWWKVSSNPTVLGIPGSGSVFRYLLPTRNVILMNAYIPHVFLFVAFKEKYIFNEYIQSHAISV